MKPGKRITKKELTLIHVKGGVGTTVVYKTSKGHIITEEHMLIQVIKEMGVEQ